MRLARVARAHDVHHLPRAGGRIGHIRLKKQIVGNCGSRGLLGMQCGTKHREEKNDFSHERA
jgi:hypothetical protein